MLHLEFIIKLIKSGHLTSCKYPVPTIYIKSNRINFKIVIIILKSCQCNVIINYTNNFSNIYSYAINGNNIGNKKTKNVIKIG